MKTIKAYKLYLFKYYFRVIVLICGLMLTGFHIFKSSFPNATLRTISYLIVVLNYTQKPTLIIRVLANPPEPNTFSDQPV